MEKEEKPLIKKTIDDEFMICDSCGYRDGFHTSFERRVDSHIKLNFKCPECGQRYDIGLFVPLKNNRSYV